MYCISPNIINCWNIIIFYIFGGTIFLIFFETISFLIFCRGNFFILFSIFCGNNFLIFLRGRFGPFAKVICVMNFVFDMVFLKGRPFGPKGHSGNHLWDNLRLGLAKKKVENIPRGDLLDQKVTLLSLLNSNRDPRPRLSQNQRLADCPLRIWTYQIHVSNKLLQIIRWSRKISLPDSPR